MSAELQFLVSLSIDAYGPVGVFDTRDGGDPDVNNPLHRPGGMGPQVAYAGLPTFSAITVGRVLDNENRSDSALIASLDPFVGRSLCTVTEQLLDVDGNAFGTPTTWRGMFSGIMNGVVDSNSENPRMWSCKITTVTKAP